MWFIWEPCRRDRFEFETTVLLKLHVYVVHRARRCDAFPSIFFSHYELNLMKRYSVPRHVSTNSRFIAALPSSPTTNRVTRVWVQILDSTNVATPAQTVAITAAPASVSIKPRSFWNSYGCGVAGDWAQEELNKVYDSSKNRFEETDRCSTLAVCHTPICGNISHLCRTF